MFAGMFVNRKQETFSLEVKLKSEKVTLAIKANNYVPHDDIIKINSIIEEELHEKASCDDSAIDKIAKRIVDEVTFNAENCFISVDASEGKWVVKVMITF